MSNGAWAAVAVGAFALGYWLAKHGCGCSDHGASVGAPPAATLLRDRVAAALNSGVANNPSDIRGLG